MEKKRVDRLLMSDEKRDLLMKLSFLRMLVGDEFVYGYVALNFRHSYTIVLYIIRDDCVCRHREEFLEYSSEEEESSSYSSSSYTSESTMSSSSRSRTQSQTQELQPISQSSRRQR